MRPHLQIGPRIAGVVEPSFAEMLDQQRGLVGASQIAFAIAAVYRIEPADMRGHCISQHLVGSGAEDFRTSLRLDAQPAEDALVVGQCSHVDRGAQRYLSFQMRFAFGEPGDEAKQMQWIAAHERQCGLQQEVGTDQGTVKIDAKGNIAILHGWRASVTDFDPCFVWQRQPAARQHGKRRRRARIDSSYHSVPPACDQNRLWIVLRSSDGVELSVQLALHILPLG